MITCKEDLYNTWIKNDKGELCEAYLGLCTEYGIFTMGSGKPGTVDSFIQMTNVGVLGSDESISCSDFWDYSANGCKQLTLEDLKPQTKEAEWINGLPPVGLECEWRFKGEGDCSFSICKVLMIGNQTIFMKSHRAMNGYKEFALPKDGIEFRKPETPEQKLERERMENGKAYYGEVVRIEREVTGMSFDSFHRWDKLSDKYREVYAMQAEAFNYKVKGE